jgi:peptidoglycan/xylan/chitin deacetylase (PgdA/CDA1 family)
MHVPTLIISQLEEFPECIEYIREETKQGRMEPELHGMFHVDYGTLSPQHIREHLAESIDWMESYVGRSPEYWYTPWGQCTPHMLEAAQMYNLELVGVDRDWSLGKVTSRLREGRISLAELEERDLFFHWWEGGCRVLRLAKVLNLGSWEEAALTEPELFSG